MGLLLVAALVVYLVYMTAKGKRTAAFFRDARTEVRKVVWPSRQRHCSNHHYRVRYRFARRHHALAFRHAVVVPVQTDHGDLTGMTMRWYVVQAFSGFEGVVKRSLEERIERAGMSDKFGDILVPTEEVVEMRNGA